MVKDGNWLQDLLHWYWLTWPQVAAINGGIVALGALALRWAGRR